MQTSRDLFLGGKLSIQQPVSGHRSGHDAVLLAASLPQDARSACELGAGVGVASLCAAQRLTSLQITGIEIDPALHNLSLQNAANNKMEDRAKFLCGDILSGIHAMEVAAAQFDHVLANPPFYAPDQVPQLDNISKQAAHQIAPENLDKWAKCAASLLKAKGYVTWIHRADSLDTVLRVLERRFGGITVLPIYGRPGMPATRILVRGQRDSRAAMRILPGLVLQDDANQPSAEAEHILRHAGMLAL